MTNALTKSFSRRNVALFTVIALVASFVAYIVPARAAALTTASDTMSRLKISTNADHTIVFTLPTGEDFDNAGGTDVIEVDFPAGFSQSGTWATADFTFDDGTARTVDAVDAGGGTETVTCSDGANNVGVAIDTTDLEFRVIPCGASFTASGAAATITFTIDGSTADGELANPGSAGSTTVAILHDDEGNTGENSVNIAVGIVEEDTVTINAEVASELTFDIDVATGTGTENDPASNPVDLGTLSTGSVTTSNGSSVDSIFIDISTNASGGVVITAINTDTVVDLASTSTPADTISVVGTPGTTAVTAGTEGYGICVVGTPSATTGTLTTNAEYDGDGSNDGCTASTSDNVVGVPPSSAGSADTVVSSSAPVSGGDIEIAVKAAISATTEAHDDYTDAIRFIATGTF